MNKNKNKPWIRQTTPDAINERTIPKEKLLMPAQDWNQQD